MVREAFYSFLYGIAAFALCAAFCGGLMWVKKKIKGLAAGEEKHK